MPSRQGAASFEDLEVYQLSFALQQRVFDLSRSWPKEECYSLTDQVRRSTRSVGANLAEAWAKRRYEAHFVSKLTDADGELSETKHWLRSAAACDYLTKDEAESLHEAARVVGAKIGKMIGQAHIWVQRPIAVTGSR